MEKERTGLTFPDFIFKPAWFGSSFGMFLTGPVEDHTPWTRNDVELLQKLHFELNSTLFVLTFVSLVLFKSIS